MSSIIERAIELRAVIEKAAQSLDDDVASTTPEIFPAFDPNGHAYKTGFKLSYDNKVYRVLQDHISQPDWTPDVAVSLFAEVLIPDPEVIPDWVQPGSTNSYMKGDKVKHVGKTWESLIDNNVWEPGIPGTETLWQEI
jgi:hypothetical protein